MPSPLPKLKSLGERVKWARERLDMSQGDLAKAAHIDQTTISALERNAIKNPRKLDKLSEILGVPQAWLKYGIANVDKLTQEQVEAMFLLSSLSEADQAAVIALIERLAPK